MILYHTSPAPIILVDGKLDFKRQYPPSFMGIHAWRELKIAQERMSFSENEFLYEFEFPIHSIEDLISVDQSALQIDVKIPKEIAVKVMEDSGPGKSKYHVVILDYSKITSWRELYSKRSGKFEAMVEDC